MKTVLYILLLISTGAFAQSASDTVVDEAKINLRHIEGFRAFDVSTGKNLYGQQYSFGSAYYESEKLIVRVTLSYEFGKINLTSYNTNYLLIELNHTVYKIHDALFFNLGYGILAGEENSSNEVLNNKTNTFSYGLLLDANVEIYVLKKVALLIEFKELWDNGSNFGSFRYYGNGGLRLFL